jgi:hypothetical protein
MFTDTLRPAAGSIILAICLATSTGAMSNLKRTSEITFTQAVLLPGVSLPRGTYIFELPEPDLACNLVRVLSKDRSKVLVTGFTRMVHRPMASELASLVLLGEHSGHTPPRVTVWYPQDEVTGREFIY